MKRFLFITVVLICVSFSVAVSAEDRGTDCKCRPSFGSYCKGKGWGWYGAKKEIKTQAEAKDVLEKFFSEGEGSDTKIGRINEKARFFEVEILDKNGSLIDLVIIDKKTGRIRSIY